MECETCGPSVNHEVLFRCERCLKGFCSRHINSHHEVQDTSQYMQTPETSWAIDLSAFAPYARPTREPTKQEYEQFLRNNPQILTTGRESIDLILGLLLLAFFFGFRGLVDGTRSPQAVLLLTIIIGPAFILHELGHKYAAIHYGKYARFALIRQMAFITLMFGFLGFGIAGPGATMILGRSDERENGIFAAAGPSINFGLSIIGLSGIYVFPDVTFSYLAFSLHQILYFLVFFNAFLALFNLIPVSLLDGKKILNWNLTVWAILVIINVGTLILSYPHAPVFT